MKRAFVINIVMHTYHIVCVCVDFLFLFFQLLFSTMFLSFSVSRQFEMFTKIARQETAKHIEFEFDLNKKKKLPKQSFMQDKKESDSYIVIHIHWIQHEFYSFWWYFGGVVVVVVVFINGKAIFSTFHGRNANYCS